jgi:putative tryptophan/tyrosine transport system substrate-binding protein
MPGGNVTGLSILAPELGGKRLELLKEVVPKITRIAFLWALGGAGAPITVKETQAAARTLRLEFQPLTNPSPLINTHHARIVEFAKKNRLPAMYSSPEIVDAGGLMSYGSNPTDQYRRAAIYVDKILKGAKPGDLPVEQPTKFEFIINLKAAKQIGLTIPPNVLVRADRVIR